MIFDSVSVLLKKLLPNFIEMVVIYMYMYTEYIQQV